MAALASATSVRASEAQLGGSCQTSSQNSISLGSTIRTITDTNNQPEKVNTRIPRYGRDLPVALTITAEAKTLEIRVGNQIFRLDGQNGNLLVDNKMAAALRNAPDGKAIIRITLEGSGASIVSNVGSKTIKARKSVY